MKSGQLSLITMIFSVGCAAPPAVQLPDDVGLPAIWGPYSSQVLTKGSCPVIAGRYKSVPEHYKLVGAELVLLRENEYAFYSLFPFDLATSVAKRDITYLGSAQKTLLLKQLDSTHIELTHIWANGKFLEVNVFSAAEGDFVCADGFIEFPIVSTYGQIEGTAVNGQNRRKIRKLEDGSLVVLRTFGPFRLGSTSDSNDFSHEIYRFPPEGSDAKQASAK